VFATKAGLQRRALLEIDWYGKRELFFGAVLFFFAGLAFLFA